MQESTQYRRFAEECLRLAKEAATEHERKVLEEMAEAWKEARRRIRIENSIALDGLIFPAAAGIDLLVCQAKPHLRHL